MKTANKIASTTAAMIDNDVANTVLKTPINPQVSQDRAHTASFDTQPEVY